MKYRNPIIPGYSPDPSICRVGDDFYLVNSSFEFFPGVPIYHSTNLVNWELIGHVLDRESQLHLEGCRNSGGIYAPTIRHHDGRFYMITTNVTDKGNFVVHADNPKGPWSEPAWIDQGGIDPSLFWDDDGTCYYCSTGTIDGVRGIVGFVINPDTGEILSDKKIIGIGCGGMCTEGPHIYKRNGWYYLMTAEGGTEYGHREAIGRSRSFWGPYENCPDRQILSHRERKRHEIQATGHADLVEGANGNWWAVFLGIRNFSKALLHNLGRETFLAPVSWNEDGWPVIGHNGLVELWMEGELPGEAVTKQDFSMNIDFAKPLLQYNVMFTRNPVWDNYVQDTKERTLLLKGTNLTLDTAGVSPTIVSFRQPEFCTTVLAKLSLKESDAARTGISAYYNNEYHYDIYVGNDENGKYIGFYKHIHDMGVELVRVAVPEKCENVRFQIVSDREKYRFSYAFDDEAFVEIGSGLNAGLSTEGTCTMTFTGTLYAVFAENGNGKFLEGVRMDAVCEESGVGQ